MNRRKLGKAIACWLAVQTLLGGGLPLPGSATLPASAQTATTSGGDLLAVSPPSTDLEIAPGHSSSQLVTLSNGSDQPRTFTTSLQNYVANGDLGAGDYTPDEGPFSLQAWMKVTPATLTIPPHGSADFTVAINVPNNAGPGGHFGAVVFTPVVGPAVKDANVSVIARIGSVFLVNVPGAVNSKATLQSFTADKSFYQKGPVKFSVVIKNEGNVVVRPKGTITITNVFGSKVATLKLDEARALPDSTRRFDVTWDHKSLFGPYTAKLNWQYGDPAVVGHADKKIWGAPVGRIILVVVVVLVLFFLVWLPRKRVKKALRAFADSGDDPKAGPGPEAKPEHVDPVVPINDTPPDAGPTDVSRPGDQAE